jgi:hypothetical protein
MGWAEFGIRLGKREDGGSADVYASGVVEGYGSLGEGAMKVVVR